MNKYIALILAFGFLCSCDDFLDRDSETRVSKEQLFEDIIGAEVAIAGAYDELASQSSFYRENFILYPELKGGNLKFGKKINSGIENDWRSTYEFTHSSLDEDNDDDMINVYRDGYKLMNMINNVIEGLANLEDVVDEAYRDQLMGEALTLRALNHFNLSNLYAQPYLFTANGDHLGVVTLEKTPGAFDQPSRDKLYETYEFIIDDLNNAIALLNQTREGTLTKAWLSKSAAQALLARVYLYKNDWNNARLMATEVIGNPEFMLIPNDLYESEFKEHDNLTSEDIWVLEQSNNQAENLSIKIGVGTDGKSQFCVTKDLMELFDDNDVRKTLFATSADNDTVTWKYQSLEKFESMIKVFRLSEMYLIRSESSARIGDYIQARSDLQAIRERANPDAEQINLSGQELIDEIMREKRREFALEGHLYFDLARTGTNVERNDYNGIENKDLSFPDYRFVLPIPDYAIDYNENMKQNPDYE